MNSIWKATMMKNSSYTYRKCLSAFIFLASKCCSFTGAVKLKSIMIVGGDNGSSPKKLSLYVFIASHFNNKLMMQFIE